MSAERLAEAARRIRHDLDFDQAHGDPLFLAVVADWLEAEVRRVELAFDTYDWTGHPGLAVADAYLGGT